MSDAQLEILAGRAGLAVDWIDANGRPQKVAPSVLRNVLIGLGHPASTAQEIDASLLQLQEVQQTRHLPPLITADFGVSLDLAHFFEPESPCEIHLEDGSRLNLKLDAEAQLPGLVPVGYQHVSIDGQSFTLAVAPARCYSVGDAVDSPIPRTWGLSVQLYSLRRAGDGGFGDTQALEDLARVAGERGAEALAISPLHAMFGSDTQRYSPYSPSSRLFLNSLYAAPGAILGERAWRAAIDATGLAAELQHLEEQPLIDWPVAAEAKHRLLQALYEGFVQGEHPLHADFSSFRHAAGEALENHCRFEAIQEARAAKGETLDWREWPEQWRDPRSAALAEFAEENAGRIGFFAFSQWLITRCLERAQTAARSAGMSIGLIADLAVGADGGGSQAWSRQDELLASLTVGAPPDILNRTGQGWGISAFSPEGLVRNGFRAFIEMLRANFAHAGGLRIDHVMGLQRLWVIPNGSPPADGAYLYYPVDDLLRLLSLESHRHQAIVLGEDLGTVADGLREKLIARSILGMRVLLFEQDNAHFKSILDWPDNALATTSTHDLPTLNGWWHGRDIDWNARLGLVDATGEIEWRHHREREREGLRRVLSEDPQNFREESHETDQILDAAVRFLGHTRAPLVLLPLEDALGIEQQANLPGTIDTHPNWSRRLPGSSEALLDDPDASRRLELLACARLQAGERDQ
ncbi:MULTISPECIES: 4-alpha-glucanotransferase [Pseudomonas]|jgi:4-alpha-glucanotransferase|uniref:4-alpha-glucanotransferase n=3 Tax=Pseudomonas fluorescens group TaxID=136843 RepID=A0AB36D3L6_9PSED|nr:MULTISPECIES: 4-alpha-glucanotransferase [Pseudomonas]MBU0522188.1 4-alpha-glucanotransferase [Gammaproteobacteria bacterium]MDF9881255.1 4-alpha-glucanotransferase [Pseudomonas silensiensis]AHZ67660.1 4-alpha-glucanotransferase [Pseudomonas mandelii JR-1]MBU0817977.1 4-alpha-glucanotransferase [Gammaproteobacteria bacterium]MBU0841477.1 4-alpha-glucanotransferase [Gammaproteobacteria bacterium]